MNDRAIAEVDRIQNNEGLHMSEYHCLLMAMEWAYKDSIRVCRENDSTRMDIQQCIRDIEELIK